MMAAAGLACSEATPQHIDSPALKGAFLLVTEPSALPNWTDWGKMARHPSPLSHHSGIWPARLRQPFPFSTVEGRLNCNVWHNVSITTCLGTTWLALPNLNGQYPPHKPQLPRRPHHGGMPELPDSFAIQDACLA